MLVKVLIKCLHQSYNSAKNFNFFEKLYLFFPAQFDWIFHQSDFLVGKRNLHITNGIGKKVRKSQKAYLLRRFADLFTILILNFIQSKNLALFFILGHHALNSVGNGFCLLNNVAIAAKWAKKEGKAQKILIVDLDVHHGQSTQYNFYDDPNVLYFSIHRYEMDFIRISIQKSTKEFPF